MILTAQNNIYRIKASQTYVTLILVLKTKTLSVEYLPTTSHHERVNFVNEDSRWCIIARKLEQCANKLFTVTSPLRDNARCGDVEERSFALCGDSFSQQGLPRPGWPVQQYSLPRAQKPCKTGALVCISVHQH